MRVLVVNRNCRPSITGAEQMAVRTAAALAAQGDDVRSAGDPTSLATACASWVPDVVHLVDLVDPELGVVAGTLARRLGAGFAITPASVPSFWADEAAGIELCRSADLLFCLTRAEQGMLRDLGVEGPEVRILPQAPALLGGGDGRRFRDRHGLRGPLVLFLGRKARSKGYRELLAAAPAVWRHSPDAHFVFLGSSWDEDCEAHFRRHRDRRVLNLGPVDNGEKEDALAACELLCLPTRADVAPLVFAEAWSYGKPVVSGAFPGVGEVIEEDRDGLIVDGRDPAAIAAAITALLGDKERRRRLGARGREKVEAELSWEAVAAKVRQGYRDLKLGTRTHP